MGVAAQNRQKKDTIQRKENIKAADYMIPKRRGADKFESKKGTEHLFFSAGAGMVRLFDMGSGFAAHGPKASFYVGNWVTPVIGFRAGVDYSMWRGNTDTNLVGGSVDYLINISAFAARYNPRRVFEVIAIGGISYQATMKTGMETIHSYGLHGGLQGKFNISPAFNLFIEPQLGLYPDRVDNHFSWRRYDVIASMMLGITYKPSGFSQSGLLRNGFASIGAGMGNTGNMLFNTEFALGKWFGKPRINGIRISAGSSTAFLDNDLGGVKREFNVNLCADYLCNLTTLFSDRKSRIFDLLFIGGAGSYFPGGEASEPIVLNGRIGFQGQIRLSEHVGLWLEPRINIFKDKSYRADLQEPVRGTVGVMVGTSYKF
ncbi:hypothetical protein KGMB02408_17290 [Bacteroides faecalis]|uniref:Uncharacterized protein n=2 Tax=Bacteroides faecalis TaxID=2447885 RepID=A0A401LTE5_9BACE|nr:hypothetical protein [Bacteroides faecalis]GCB34784.1 hypothetical protein KGMB02408_17290 [Bacteroides faecalis]